MPSPIFSEPSQCFFSDYNLHSKPLSRSAFSEVTLCQKISNQKQRIVKIIPKAILSSVVINDRVIFSMFFQLKRLKHEGLVKLYQVYESKNSFYIVSQFLEAGSLDDLVEDGPVNEKKTREIIQQVLELAQFLGGLGFDLEKVFQVRPENVLIRDPCANKVVVNLLCGRVLVNDECCQGMARSAGGRQAVDRSLCLDLGLLSWFLQTQSRVLPTSDQLKSDTFKSLSSSYKDFLETSLNPISTLKILSTHRWFTSIQN
jgi:hypothetical protein